MRTAFTLLISCLLMVPNAFGASQSTKKSPLPLRTYKSSTVSNFYGVRPLKSAPVSYLYSPASDVELIGNVISSKGAGKGMYSFTASSTITMNKLLPDVEFNGSAVYVNGKYYAQNYDYDNDYNLTKSQWYVYDAESWTLERTVDLPLDDWSYVGFDRTYDPSTGNVYSITADTTGDVLCLSTTDLADGKSTVIGALEKDVFCIAANASGEVFAIDINANLYKVNKATAELTLIGNTNIFESYESNYSQSATIDYATGKMYWAEFHTVGWFTAASALYEIDTNTASTVKIADIPNNEEILGLCIPVKAAAGTPAAGTDFSVNYTATGSTQASFSFTAPKVATTGALLDTAEALMIEITVDSDVIDLIEAQPGEKVTTDVYAFERGLHSVKIKAENSLGLGEPLVGSFYAGYDVPGAVGNLKLTTADSYAELSWSAPTEGAEGGAIREPITYEVVRMPGNVVVSESQSGTTFREFINTPNLYSYTVTPVSQDGRGTSATSNALVISDFPVPYSETFDTADDASLFMIIDNNGDGKSWSYDETGHRMKYTYGVANAADDYLITPGIKLESGKSYTISFKLNKEMENYTETMDILYGTTADIASFKKLVTIDDMAVEPETRSLLVAALADGAHYFAFKATSPKNQYRFYLDDLSIVESGSAGVPAVVTSASAIPGAAGAKQVTVECVAPTTTLDGTAITSLASVDIYRVGSSEPVKTFANPTPGEKLSWTDTAAKQGTNQYLISATNEVGTSESVSVSAYVGVDIPKSITDLKLVITDGTPKITWTAPSEGVNGGSLAGLLSYDIVRVVNNEETTIATGYADTQYTDDWTVTDQAFIYYAVTPKTSAGAGETSYTDGVVVGDPYVAPYAESFAGAKTQTNPWAAVQVAGTVGSWAKVASGEYPYAQAQDGDGGMAMFDGFHTQAGNALRLVSPMIKINHLKSPKLSYWMYHFNGNDGWHPDEQGPEYVKEQLVIEVAKNSGAFVEVPGSNVTLYAANNGWVEHIVDLTDYKDAEYINLGFKGTSGYTYNILIDNIRVYADFIYDAYAESLTGPASVKIGEEATLTATVGNNGTATINNVAVRLKKDGTIVASKLLRSIAGMANTTVEFTITGSPADANTTNNYTVEVGVATDENSLNNESKALAIATEGNDLPVVDDLAVNAVEGESMTVDLTWNKPEEANIFDGVAAEPDDMESYEAFAIQGYGDYILVDGDGKTTYSVTDGTTYANKSIAKSFMVFNPSAISIPDYKFSKYAPYSGNQYLAAFSASSGKTDDWLIMAVPEGVSSFSFMAKSQTTRYGNEEFIVKYSTTGTSTTDFAAIKSQENVDDTWTKFEYTLPEGTKYVAINYVSEDKFMFMVDDILLGEAAPDNILLGYNVYRNGAKINAEMLANDAASYRDALSDAGDYDYAVTAIYKEGESCLSNIVTVSKQGGVAALTTDAKIYANGGRVYYSNLTGTLKVFAANGICVKVIDNSASGSFALQTGVYVAECDGKMVKIIIK